VLDSLWNIPESALFVQEVTLLQKSNMSELLGCFDFVMEISTFQRIQQSRCSRFGSIVSFRMSDDGQCPKNSNYECYTIPSKSKSYACSIRSPILSSVHTVCWNYRVTEKHGAKGNFIYFLHYVLYMLVPPFYSLSQPLYRVWVHNVHHIGTDSSTAAGHALPEMMVPDFNSTHLCASRIPTNAKFAG
jgi:hypothetical protein